MQKVAGSNPTATSSSAILPHTSDNPSAAGHPGPATCAPFRPDAVKSPAWASSSMAELRTFNP
jgi:hypothetical protein